MSDPWIPDRTTGKRTAAPQLLDDVSWDVFVTDADIAPSGSTRWPPERFRRRQKRIADLRTLWQGGWPAGVSLGGNLVTPPMFPSYSQRLANLLLMSEPTSPAMVVADAETWPAVGQRNELHDICHDGIVDLTRFGGVVLVRIGDEVVVADPAGWFPFRDGAHLVSRTYYDEGDEPVGSTATEPNRIELTIVEDGMVETRVHRYQPDRIGELVDVDDVVEGAIEVIPREPRIGSGLWGRAKYLDMYSMVLEIARRYSRNSRTFDLHARPVPVFQESDLDARARFDVDPDADDDEAQRKILEGQLGILEEDTIHLPDNILAIKYLQPNVQGATYALAQVTDLREQLRDVTGLPDLTGQTVSGDALKRLFVHWYAESLTLQNEYRLGLERLLGAEVEWPHIFDTDIFAAPMQPPSQPAADGGSPSLQAVRPSDDVNQDSRTVA